MTYIKWILIYLAIPVFCILLIGLALLITPSYHPVMFAVPIVLTLWLLIELVISTVKEEKGKLNN